MKASHRRMGRKNGFVGDIQHSLRKEAEPVHAKVGNVADANQNLPLIEHENARRILGEYFVSPEEIRGIVGVDYSEKQISHLTKTIPSEEVLWWLRDSGYLLVAGPPIRLSLYKIHGIKREFFFNSFNRKDGSNNYLGRYNKFLSAEMVSCRWLIVSKAPIAKSSERDEFLLKNLACYPEYVPKAVEIVWASMAFRELRNRWPSRSLFCGTSSVGASGLSVFVGFLSDKMAFVFGRLDGDGKSKMGAASALKV